MSSEAELYALTHRGNSGDLQFYRRVCRNARYVLELGSGYGRVLEALAARSRLVVGLEHDAALIALSRRKLRTASMAQSGPVQLVEGDMCRFALAARFDRVLLPYNALYCLLRKRDALACFRCIALALKPRGVFALDVWNSAELERRRNGGHNDDGAPIVSLVHRRRVYDVFERSRLNRARKRLDVAYCYRPRDGGRALRISIPQRYFSAKEVDDLLRRAGLVLEARYGDFSGGPFRARSPQQIVVARKR